MKRRLLGHLSPREVAKRLLVNEATVRRWFKEGRFPKGFQTAGRRIWIPSADLDGWRVFPESSDTAGR